MMNGIELNPLPQLSNRTRTQPSPNQRVARGFMAEEEVFTLDFEKCRICNVGMTVNGDACTPCLNKLKDFEKYVEETWWLGAPRP
eukprot:g80030.t1